MKIYIYKNRWYFRYKVFFCYSLKIVINISGNIFSEIIYLESAHVQKNYIIVYHLRLCHSM